MRRDQLSTLLIAVCVACDPKSSDEAGEGAGSKCADFVGLDNCAHATQDDLPCGWYEVQHVVDPVTCEAEVVGECLQHIMQGGTTGCGAARAYFAEDDDGNIALASVCGDNPPRAYETCGVDGAPEECACFVEPE